MATVNRRPLPGLFVLAALVLSGVILTACDPNAVESDPPVAGFTYTSTRVFPITVNFVNTSVSSGPGPATYTWDFGDGSTSTLPNSVSHIYVNPGIYMIKLIQIESSGTRDTVTMTLNLNSLGPSGSSSRGNAASFTMSIQGNTFATTFTNTSVNASSYLWEFGDGTTSTSASTTVTKNYTAPGTYHVLLTATNQAGVDTAGAMITF